MEFEKMELTDLEARKAEIAGMIDSDDADLDALETEVRAINEEIEKRKNAEAKKVELRKAVAKGEGEVITEQKEERKMDNKEVRNSRAYIDAFAEYVKTGKADECRSLLSDAAANGTVPVPTFVQDIVAERVRESKILSRCRKAEAPGVLKTGFEISAPEATIHAEGAAAPAEEALVLGIVTMNPASFKKWITFSDELMDSSEAFLRYIYDEVARGIVKGKEKAVVQAILAAPQTATATAPAVAKTGAAAAAITDIVDARALLAEGADDIVVLVNPTDYALYRGLQLQANYGADPFDGREVIVTPYATAPIVGDLYGVTVNSPKGDEIEFKLDDKTQMTADIVRLLGRQAGSVAVTSNLFFAKVSA